MKPPEEGLGGAKFFVYGNLTEIYFGSNDRAEKQIATNFIVLRDKVQCEHRDRS